MKNKEMKGSGFASVGIAFMILAMLVGSFAFLPVIVLIFGVTGVISMGLFALANIFEYLFN